MVELQLQLPESTSEFISEVVASGKYGSASDFVCDLVETVRLRTAQLTLRDLADAGENSGLGEEYTPEWWQNFTAKLRAAA
ncbi:MAG: type II toxin-antitoxin system ParD family antitoxin [Pirellulaceae bacterium]